PEAHARKARPGSATSAPISNSSNVGFAKNKKSAPHTNPSGTRQRCIHVPPLANRHQLRGYQHVRSSQTFLDRTEHAFDFDVHADPLRARSSMTIFATANVRTLDANVFRVRTTVSPPFGRPKQADDGCVHSDRQMGWARFAPDVNLCAFCQRAKALQRNRHRLGFA